MTDLRDDDANIALVVGRQGAATGQGEWNLALVTRNIVDFNIFSRGGGYVFPRRVRDSSGIWLDNVSPSAIARFAKSLSAPPGADDVFDYIYGCLEFPHLSGIGCRVPKVRLSRNSTPGGRQKF